MENRFEGQYDVLIAGMGVAGLFCTLHLPADCRVLLLSKDGADKSDSFLAQGGICMLRSPEDYACYFEDTVRAGHGENDPAAVELMIRSSPAVIAELVGFGVDFARDEKGNFRRTREGGHSVPRILFHGDETGRAIASRLLAAVRQLPNAEIAEYCELLDIVAADGVCRGGIVRDGRTGKVFAVSARRTLLASGGVGGLYENSTNYRHLTGDGVAVALKNGVQTEHLDYVQIHPTTFYSEKHGRRFLISESVRGEGAVLLGADGRRFCNELLPRDVVTAAIRAQMAKEGLKFVRLDMRPVGEKTLREHFPTICAHCLAEGYDVTKTPVPVVPAQHYFMGGVKVDLWGRTSMRGLYAAGETACNGVHGRNRLASNSLLESLVWAERAAQAMASDGTEAGDGSFPAVDLSAYADYEGLKEGYAAAVRAAMQKQKQEQGEREAKS